MSCLVFLIQTDTTVGLLSKDKKRLFEIKKRDNSKNFLRNISSFKELKDNTRIPKRFKKIVRRKKKSTFIFPNSQAFRVVKEGEFGEFLKRFGWQYSTSANRSKERFDFNYIKDKVDIIIHTPKGFKEEKPSSLFVLTNYKIRRLR
ncbi:MAG: Sua5 YciO YrdC YwlC family protein [Epsilonproteobacteria bacterium]|nr:Sua5 YciO YrdC YwlC family protein [Campylobacterota bacterium]